MSDAVSIGVGAVALLVALHAAYRIGYRRCVVASLLAAAAADVAEAPNVMADSLLAVGDAMDLIVDAAEGHRIRCEAAGFDALVSQHMAYNLYAHLTAQVFMQGAGTA